LIGKILVSVLVIGLSLGVMSGCKKNISVEQKEQGISNKLKEALPAGLSVQNLVSYLDANKFEHGEYDRLNHTLQAIIRNVSRTPFVFTHVQIVFEFDEKDKLITFKWKEVYTGL